MSTVMKNAPKKQAAKKKAAAVEITAVGETVIEESSLVSASPTLVFIPADRLPLPTRTPDANAQLSSCLKSIVAFDDESRIADVVDTLTDDEFAAVWEWMRQVDWLLSETLGDGKTPAATRADVTAPSCISAYVEKGIATPEAIADMLPDVEVMGVAAAFDPPTDAPSTTHQATEVAAPEAVTGVTSVDNQATVNEPDATGQLPLVKEGKQPAKKITALALESSDDVASVRLALQARADDLEAKAKQLVTLGKTAEAFSLRKEVARLKEKVDKQLSVQTAIAFNVNESIPKMVSRYVAGEIRSRTFAALMKSKAIKKGESAKDAEDRQRAKLDDLEALIGNIGEQAGAHVATLVVEAYERGKDQGLRERNATASQIVREAIEAAEAQRAQ